MPRPAALRLPNVEGASVGVEVADLRPAQLALAAAGQERSLREPAEVGQAGITPRLVARYETLAVQAVQRSHVVSAGDPGAAVRAGAAIAGVQPGPVSMCQRGSRPTASLARAGRASNWGCGSFLPLPRPVPWGKATAKMHPWVNGRKRTMIV